MKLDKQDLSWAIRRLPSHLKKLMESPEWRGKIFVGGGYLRSLIAREDVNDVDVFVKVKSDAHKIAALLTDDPKNIHTTDNAITIKGKLPIQVITRWVFDKPEDVSNSFDFTICCAVVFFEATYDFEGRRIEPMWDSYCDDRFYMDLAAKRLVYRNPVREEEAGGSMLRVLKYYKKGYLIPLDSFGQVIARLMKGVHLTAIDKGLSNTDEVALVVTGLLREVDPSIDPLRNSHLPSSTAKIDQEILEDLPF